MSKFKHAIMALNCIYIVDSERSRNEKQASGFSSREVVILRCSGGDFPVAFLTNGCVS